MKKLLFIITVAAATTAAAETFNNNANISIPSLGTASPYPSAMVVSGLDVSITSVSVTFWDLSHTWPADIDALLVSPAGGTVMLMSDAGGDYAVDDIDVTFADGAPALPYNGQILSGTYAPQDYIPAVDELPAPAPGGAYGTSFASLTGTNPNGTWQLFIRDDNSDDMGSIGFGWSLTVTAVPEPGGLALLVGVLLASALLGRRRA